MLNNQNKLLLTHPTNPKSPIPNFVGRSRSEFFFAGVDPNLVKKILDPHFLSRASVTFGDLRETIQTNGPWASSWIGESGGAYNSGGLHVSDTFVNSFW